MKLKGVSPECIGQHNVAPRFYVPPVYPAYLLRMRDIPQLRQFSRLQSLFLKYGYYSPVKKQQLSSKSFLYHNMILFYHFRSIVYRLLFGLYRFEQYIFLRRPHGFW